MGRTKLNGGLTNFFHLGLARFAINHQENPGNHASSQYRDDAVGLVGLTLEIKIQTLNKTSK